MIGEPRELSRIERFFIGELKRSDMTVDELVEIELLMRRAEEDTDN